MKALQGVRVAAVRSLLSSGVDTVRREVRVDWFQVLAAKARFRLRLV